jgi:ribosomal 30S subunit maturation factor RimM
LSGETHRWVALARVLRPRGNKGEVVAELLPAGKYFVSDLVGCSVFESPLESPVVSSSPCSLASAPALIGTVSDVQMTGEDVAGTPLLVVDALGGELLIPLAENICTRIDPAARRIDVTLPDGLRNLNNEK